MSVRYLRCVPKMGWSSRCRGRPTAAPVQVLLSGDVDAVKRHGDSEPSGFNLNLHFHIIFIEGATSTAQMQGSSGALLKPTPRAMPI